MTTYSEPSPQVGSYGRFREHLGEKLQAKLGTILAKLAEEGKINFTPRVTVQLDNADYPDEKEENAALIRGETLEERLCPWVNLGEGLRRWDLGLFPSMTARGSFIQNGMERCMVAQLGKSPGVFFTRVERMYRHDIAEFRPEHGNHLIFRKTFKEKPDPVRVVFSEGQWVDLEWFIDVLGVPKEHLGSLCEGFTGFRCDISKIARNLGLGGWLDEQKFSTSDEDKALIRKAIQDKFYGSLMGVHGRAQLNRRIRQVDPSYNETSQYITPMDVANILRVFEMFCRKEIPEDDRWDLANREVRLVDSFLADAVDHWTQWMDRRIREAIKEKGDVIGQEVFWEILQEANASTHSRKRNEAVGISRGRTLFSRVIQEKIFDSPLCQRLSKEQNNFIEAAGLTRRIKFDGEGHRREAREFHWSHYGRLCPLDTPQSDDVGTTLSLALGARVNEAGVIESCCHRVSHGENGIQIEESDVFLPPWDETGSGGWVAFPDQRDALLEGKDVFAHRGPERYEQVDAREVAYIHADEVGMFSMAANLLPYRKHNDSVRGVMACSMLRQSLPLKDGTPPQVETGFEAILPKEWPFPYGYSVDAKLAFGRELLVGYLPWKGWNFEDAIVVSESAADTLTSVHDSQVFVQLRRSIEEHKRTLAKSVRDAGLKKDEFDDMGVIKGRFVSKGDLLVIERGARNTPRPHEVPEGKQGVVHKVDAVDAKDEKGGAYLRVTLRQECRAQVGDKLANRHGHKGVISRIFPDHEMPYFLLGENENDDDKCLCGETRPHRHLDTLINPLSVISRMNLGQLYEMVEARSEDIKVLPQRVPCFDPTRKNEGGLQLGGDILIGEQYIMKLDHNAEDKLHARSREPGSYNSFVDQPLKGRRLKGGQRVGEMEGWALMAHNASALMQEMYTLKSDNPRERDLLYRSILGGVPPTATPRLPEALRTLAACYYGLGLQLRIKDSEGREVDILHETDDIPKSENIQSLTISLIGEANFLGTVSKGEVKTPLIRPEKSESEVTTPPIREVEVECKYHRDGLESEQIFGPERKFSCACGKHQWDAKAAKEEKQPKQKQERKRPRKCETCGTPLLPAHCRRHRMGYIKLAKPVPNPYVLLSNRLPTWSYIDVNSLLQDEPRFKFYPGGNWKGRSDERIQQGWNWVYEFCTLALRCSASFTQAFEEKFNTLVGTDPVKQDVALVLDEDWAEIAALLRDSIGAEGNSLTVEEFVEQGIGRYGPVRKGLDAVSGLMAAVLQEGDICGIDFLIDLLRSQKNLKPLCLDVLPVMPPKLRQRFCVSHKNGQGKKYKAHDLNMLYQKVLQKNEDLAKSLVNVTKGSPEVSGEYRKCRMALQLAVSQLLCNQLLPPRKRARDWETPGDPVRHSISSYLEDKNGLLVGHLLGKRVDYSGRAVIVPDPELPLDTCRIPIQLAIKLYRPQLFAALRQKGVKSDADIVIDRAVAGDQGALDQVRLCLEEIVKTEEDSTIGDDVKTLLKSAGQGDTAAKEQMEKMLQEGIAASPESSKLQSMVLLNRQPTLHRLGMLGFKVELGDDSVIAIPPLVTSGYNADFDGDQMAIYLPLTQAAQAEVPQMVPSNHLWHPAHGGYALSMAQDLALGGYLNDQGAKKKLVVDFENAAGEPDLLDRIESFKTSSFEKSTQAGISFSIEDLQRLEQQCTGLATGTTEEAVQGVKQVISTAPDNDVFKRILISGARGDWDIMNHLAGRSQQERSGSNLTQGFQIGEELREAVSGRRNLVDTKLGTAEGGALTKSFVAAAHHLWITEDDCSTDNGLPVSMLEHILFGWGDDLDLKTGPIAWKPEAVELLLFRRLYGRVLAEDFNDYTKGTYLDQQSAMDIASILANTDGEEKAIVRSPLTCNAEHGICRTCYGLSWTRGTKVDGWSDQDLVAKGERVGIIAAQAVGEPGTQMALRKKHVVGEDDAPGIKTVKKFFEKDIAAIQQCGARKDLDEPLVILRDTMDRLYRDNGIHIAPIHFEMVFAGRLKGVSGWLAEAANQATGNIHSVIVKAALGGAVDDLQGLKERAVIGAGLPEA